MMSDPLNICHLQINSVKTSKPLGPSTVVDHSRTGETKILTMKQQRRRTPILETQQTAYRFPCLFRCSPLEGEVRENILTD